MGCAEAAGPVADRQEGRRLHRTTDTTNNEHAAPGQRHRRGLSPHSSLPQTLCRASNQAPAPTAWGLRRAVAPAPVSRRALRAGERPCQPSWPSFSRLFPSPAFSRPGSATRRLTSASEKHKMADAQTGAPPPAQGRHRGARGEIPSLRQCEVPPSHPSTAGALWVQQGAGSSWEANYPTLPPNIRVLAPHDTPLRPASPADTSVPS